MLLRGADCPTATTLLFLSLPMAHRQMACRLHSQQAVQRQSQAQARLKHSRVHPQCRMPQHSQNPLLQRVSAPYQMRQVLLPVAGSGPLRLLAAQVQQH